MSDLGLLGVQLFRHARRELDVEVFDGEFAGDEARQKHVARFDQLLICTQVVLQWI